MERRHLLTFPRCGYIHARFHSRELYSQTQDLPTRSRSPWSSRFHPLRVSSKLRKSQGYIAYSCAEDLSIYDTRRKLHVPVWWSGCQPASSRSTNGWPPIASHFFKFISLKSKLYNNNGKLNNRKKLKQQDLYKARERLY